MIKKFLILFLDLLTLLLVILIAIVAARFAWLQYYKAAYPLGYSDAVFAQSEKTGVPPALLFAVMRTESGFNPNAESGIPARGLMQITQVTFDWIGFRLGEENEYDYDDMFEPELNIRYGAELLRLHLNEFGSDTNALCAYHAGRGSVNNWLLNPEYSENGEITHIPFKDTRRHVAKALQAKEVYEKLYDLGHDSGEELPFFERTVEKWQKILNPARSS